ncbi:hypothetical protein ACFQ46_16470 [Kineococcus sp. GCM10028916]|uniref:hypothetical protein n=1 Tax=Kineococcus sp. GCM10028916 TaxID=3273394 RepID=UPI0036358EED
MSQELIDTLPTHPLRQRGPARRLYAGGLVVQLLSWLFIMALAVTQQHGTGLGFVGPLTFIAADHVGTVLRRRAWWHVPLRNAGPVPDPVELAYWTFVALSLITVAAVVAFGHRSEPSGVLWMLFVLACALAALTPDKRPAPEPSGRWSLRAAPMLVAATAVLAIGISAGRMKPTSALIAWLAAACLLAFTRLVAAHRHPSDA